MQFKQEAAERAQFEMVNGICLLGFFFAEDVTLMELTFMPECFLYFDL